MKKIVAIATGLTFAAMLFPVVPVQAVTAEELQDQIDALMETLADLQDQLAELTGEPAAAECSCTFTRSLYPGVSRGDDVKCLQEYLNDSGYTLAESGAGSPGSETTYFGSLTRAAVKAWQDANDVEYGDWWGYFGPISQAKYDTTCAVGEQEEEEEEEEEASGLTVELSSDTPASQTIIAYGAVEKQAQVLIPFTTIDFTAGPEGSVKVTTLKFERTGISSDSNLDNTYLYEGDDKLAEGGSISSKVLTFNDSTGIFTVPAGETKSITLKGNLAPDVSAGKTIGFKLVSADDVTSDASEVNGDFPFSGNLMSAANATDLGYLKISGYTVPTNETTIAPQEDYQVWKFTAAANEQNLEIEKLVFTEVGSIQTDDLTGFELYYGGTLLGTAEMNADNEVIFDLSDSPFSITKGQSKILKLFADILKGSSRTFKFTFQYPTDVIVKDANYGVYVASYITLSSGWQLVQPTSNYLIDTGSMTVVKATASPTGNVALDATNVSLAKYNFKALGEDIKISSLKVAANTTGDGGLDNGKVYLDGVQVGSTKDINEYTDGSLAEGTSFTFGTSFIVPAGTTGVVEIKADVKTKVTGSFSAGNTIQVYLLHDASYDNARAQSSLTISDVPSSDKAANSLTVQAGSLTFTKSASYGNQTTVKPTTECKIGSFSMLAGSSEGVNIDSITVVFSADEEDDLENLMLKIGTEEIGSTKGNPGTSNLFSANVDLAASESKVVDVYADILSDASETTIIADVSGTGTTLDTSTAVTGSSISLQSISIGTSVLSVGIASDNPDDVLLVGQSSDIVMAKYEFASIYEAFNVSEIKVYASSETDRVSPRWNEANYRDYVNVWLSYLDSDGNTVVTPARTTFVNGMMHFTGLDIYVPANDTAKLTIYADMNAVASAGYALTGDRPQISLAYFKANSGSISSLERRTGYLRYADDDSDGVKGVTATWDTADTTLGEGSYAIKFAVSADKEDGAEIDIPMSDLNLTIADIDTVTWAAKSSATDKYGPALTFFMDCDLDGSLDGEMIYEGYALGAESTWGAVTFTASSSSISSWWSNEGGCQIASSTIKAGSGLMSTMTQTAKIVGMSFSAGFNSTYMTESKNYWADNLKINGTSYYSIEDDMGALGTNYVLNKTKPTVTRVGAENSSSMVNGTQSLLKFNVAADSAGDVGLKVMTFNVNGTDELTLNTFKLYKGGTDYTDKVVIGDDIDGTNSYEAAGTDLATGTASNVYVVFTDEEVITGGTSQEYTLKGLVAGVASTYSINTYLVDDAYPAAHDNVRDVGAGVAYADCSDREFIWSDRSYGSTHSLTSLDWINGFLVKTLGDSLSFTLSKI